jgi:two-component system, LytTR family, sensor kinase
MKKSVILFLHTGYWFMYLSLMILFLVVMSQTNAKPVGFIALVRMIFLSPIFFVAVLPGLIGFYLSYFILFLKFLKTRRIILLVIALFVISIAVGYLLVSILIQLSIASSDSDLGQFVAMGSFLSFVALINGVLGLVMRGFIAFYADIKVKEELNKKNFEVELALVKSQISPHFLFNTINNIDAMIQLDTGMASKYLNALSDIMRFMLYETKTKKIPLVNELTYIEKYVELQRIRATNPNYIHFSIVGDAQPWQIEPMLFIPIIENAFTHAEHLKKAEAIRIVFNINPDTLEFVCQNAYDETQPMLKTSGGLGKDLLLRRLSLLYQERYDYKVEAGNGRYVVKLILKPIN